VNNNDEYVRLAYQTVLEDIRFFKRQQWVVTNYTVLLYGAIIAFSKLVESKGNEWLMYLTGIIALLSISLIVQLPISTRKARDRKDSVRDEIPNDLRNLFFGKSSGRFTEFLDVWSVFGLLIFVVIGGSTLSVWALWILGCS
jgi:hypothetical protein